MQFLVGTVLGLIDKVFDTHEVIFQGMIMESAKWLTPSFIALNSFQNNTTATESAGEVILEVKPPSLYRYV